MIKIKPALKKSFLYLFCLIKYLWVLRIYKGVNDIISNEEIMELNEGTFELDCTFMKVTKKFDDKVFEFVGKGYIKQLSRNKLAFKVFLEDGQDMNVLKAFQSKTKTGQIRIDEDYCSVLAIDQLNREWISEMVDSGFHAGRGAILRGNLHEITYRKTSKIQKNRLTIKIFGDIKIPFNEVIESTIHVGNKNLKKSSLNVAIFESGNLKFAISKEKDVLNIELESIKDEPFPNNVEMRVIESIQFVIGQSLFWSVLEKQSGEDSIVKIRSIPPQGFNEPRLEPPIDFRDKDSTGDIWKLFDRYLQYIVKDNSNKYHPISEHINQVREASQGPIISEAIALSIAVEAILKSEYKDICKPTKEFEAELKKAIQYFNDWDGDQEVKKRINSSLGAMLQLSPVSAMRVLIEKGIITNDQKKAWSKLRNPSAHGVQPDFDNKLQEFITRCDIVYVLFYKLIFNKIKYEGSYTDYSSVGWPIKEFKLTSDE